jgi:membrane protein implicated in regulation of membrane protease activity
VIIVLALLLFIAAKAGIAGIPLAPILFSWFFKYAYILFDHTVRGFDAPPTLDIQMLNPLDEQRPLAQLLILGLIYLAVKFASDTIGSTAPIILAIIGGYSLLIVLLGRWELYLPLQIAIFMFCILSVFSVLRGALYERRHELELETYHSPERTEERLQAQERRQTEHELTEADPSFRPKSASTTLQIARLAAAGGATTGVARALLADFSTRFAGDPSVTAADAVSRHLIP